MPTISNRANAVVLVSTTQEINTQIAAYTIVASDADKILSVNTAIDVDVTLSGLISGQSVRVYQAGAGQITFVNGTLTGRNTFNLTKTAGIYSIVNVSVIGTDAILTGNLSN